MGQETHSQSRAVPKRPLTQWTSCLSPASLSKGSEGGEGEDFLREILQLKEISALGTLRL